MAGESENTIGTARVYLDIDATDWDTAVARAKNSAAGLGTAAEQAFDKATGAQKRASSQLLQYVAGLDRTGEQQKVLIALMKGVPVDIAKAAASAIEQIRIKTQAAAEEQAKFNALQEEAIAINKEFDRQQSMISAERASQLASNAQSQVNSLLGVSSTGAGVGRRADAEAAFIRMLDEEAAAWQHAMVINEAYDEQVASNAQSQINALLGVQTAAERAAQTRSNSSLASRFEVDGQALASQERFIQQLQRQYDYAGKTHFEILRLQAAEMGLSDTAGPLIAKLEAQAATMRGGTITAKQYQFALRGLPAQFTDIFTTLAAGQNPLTVLLYQGGQIRDMFGGWGSAMKGIGTSLKGILASPVTWGIAAAAAVAGLAYAMHLGNEEVNRLEKSLIATGGAAGQSAADLNRSALQVGEVTGKYSDARKAVEGLADSGKIIGPGLGSVAETVVDVAKVTGQSIDDIVRDFENLRTKPAESVAKLNEQYHFLTTAQYALIASLEDQGRTQDAARVAEQAYTQAMRERAQEVENNAGWIVKSAHWVRDEWMGAWNAIKQGGAPASLAEQVEFVQHELDKLDQTKIRTDRQGNLVAPQSDPRRKAQLEAQLSELRRQQVALGIKTVNDSLDAQAIQAAVDARRRTAQFASPEDKRDNALKQANIDRLASLYGVTDEADKQKIERTYKAQVEAANEAYKSAVKKRNGSPTEGIAQIKADAAAQQAAIAAQTQFTQGQFQLRQLTVEDYYKKLMDLAKQSAEVEIASIQKQIDYEKAHGASKEKIAELESQMTSARVKDAAKLQQLSQQEAEAIQRRTDAITAFSNAQDANTRSMQRNLDAMVARVGMGQREYEIAQQINGVYAEQAEQLARIDEAYVKSKDQVTRDANRNKVLAETAKRVNAITDAYDSLQMKEMDVFAGMRAAFADFSSQSLNLADNFKSVWTTGLGSIGDAAAAAATKTGNSFDDMAKQIEATAIRALTNAAVTKFIQLILGMFGYGNFNGGMGNASSVGVNNGTATAFNPWANAKGGTYDSPSLAQHLNSVLTQPTFFAFAKGGALGVAGEAGKEAIMPLSRDSNGILGVRAHGGGMAMPQINVNISGAQGGADVSGKKNSKGGIDIDIMLKQIDAQIAGGINSGTSMTSVALKQRYG